MFRVLLHTEHRGNGRERQGKRPLRRTLEDVDGLDCIELADDSAVDLIATADRSTRRRKCDERQWSQQRYRGERRWNVMKGSGRNSVRERWQATSRAGFSEKAGFSENEGS